MMKRLMLSLFFSIFSNGILNASVYVDTDVFTRRFQKIESLIDDEIKDATLLKACPNQNVDKWVLKKLQPIDSFLNEFGTSYDPMVGILTTSFANLSLSLKCFYQTDATATRTLPPNLHLDYTNSFKKTLLQHIEFAGTALKLYMQMTFYYEPPRYAKLFPAHMEQNHEMAMTCSADNLRNFYLSKSYHDLTLEDDDSDAQIATLAYKTYKPFCLSWQNNVSTSWTMHQAAFKRINSSAFETQKPSILKTTQTLAQLKIDSLTWKKRINYDQFALTALTLFKDSRISKVEIEDTELLIIEPSESKASLPTLLKKTSSTASLPSTSTTSDLSEALSQLTLCPSQQKTESSNTPQPIPLFMERVDLGETVPTSAFPHSTSFAETLDENSSSSLDAPQTDRLGDDFIEPEPLETPPSVVEQLPPIFEFLRTLEDPSPPPLIQPSNTNGSKRSSRKKTRKAHTSPKVTSSSKASSSSEGLNSAQMTASAAYKHGRAVLPLGQKMTPEAISVFLKAMDNQSSLGKGRRSKGVREALSALRSYKTMRLKKAYKTMLSIVPHVGLFQPERGKGSHCVLTIYQDGLPPKK
jgi:hypothetical protein